MSFAHQSTLKQSYSKSTISSSTKALEKPFLKQIYPALEHLLDDSVTVSYDKNAPSWSVSNGIAYIYKTPDKTTIEFPASNPTELHGITRDESLLFATLLQMEHLRITAIYHILSSK